MTSAELGRLAAPLIALLAAGCGQEARISSGIAAGVSIVNGKSDANPSGAAHEEGYQTFYTDADKRIDLQQGLLAFELVSLRECGTQVARAVRRVRDSALGAAHAHAAHAEAPRGIVDVARDDGTVTALDSLGVPAGEYCGVEFALLPLPPGANGAGTLLYVAPCFYPDSGAARTIPGLPFYPDEINHRCFDDVPVPGDVQLLDFTLPSPVVLDAQTRTHDIALKVTYDTWFDGVDVMALGCPARCDAADTDCTACTAEQLAAKPAAQAALIRNVRESVALQPTPE